MGFSLHFDYRIDVNSFVFPFILGLTDAVLPEIDTSNQSPVVKTKVTFYLLQLLSFSHTHKSKKADNMDDVE